MKKNNLNLTEENITRLLFHLDLTAESFYADNEDFGEDHDFDEMCDKLRALRSKIMAKKLVKKNIK